MIVGVQELAAAAGLLGQESPAWLWYRAGGDLMHIGMLGWALKNHDGQGLERTAAAFAAVLGITGIDVYAAVTRSRRKVEMDMTATTTVGLSEQEVYEMWRRLDNLPEVHGPPRGSPPGRKRPQPLAGERAVRPHRRVGRRDHRGRARSADRLAVGRGAPTSTTRAASSSCRPRGAAARRCT